MIENLHDMGKTILLLLLFLLALFTYGAVNAADGPNGPIQITSNRLDVFDGEGIVLFSGNVVATQDDIVANSNELYLYYDKKKGVGKAIADITTDSKRIEKIELKGSVTVKKGTRIVTGDRAIFYKTIRKIIVTGNAVMVDGDNVIEGDRITVFLEENRGVVDGPSGERVKAVIYPDDAKQENRSGNHKSR
ncbi:MAG: LptA/OstA family protein [Thermodesulfobacteriota bacterium]|nr:LptA/OstA family protein [Thermodesulfobacteriota bacterium]